MMEVEKEFLAIIANIFKIEPGTITGETRFVDDLHAKSLDILALIAETEKKFGIWVTGREARRIESVGQTIEYIKSKLRNKGIQLKP